METVGEMAAGMDQLVQIRRMNLRVVDGVDGAEHHVVRDDEEEVGAQIGGGRWKGMGCMWLHSSKGGR